MKKDRKRKRVRGEKCRKKRKKEGEVSRQDGRKFDIHGRGGKILKFTPGRI